MEQGKHLILEGSPRSAVLVVCDHASNFIPPELGDLGISKQHLNDHIAWDIGAAEVARALATELEATAILAGNSRLVVDCNRRLDDPSAFPEISDGVTVPGNRNLGVAERQERADRFYWPYHHLIRDKLCALESVRPAPVVLAVHSFTPQMNGIMRPWHLGALWDKDDRIAAPLLEYFRANKDGIVVGDNEPYSGRHPADFTLDHHAEAEGLAYLGIEIRQDLIATLDGAAQWAHILAAPLREIIADSDLYTHRAG